MQSLNGYTENNNHIFCVAREKYINASLQAARLAAFTIYYKDSVADMQQTRNNTKLENPKTTRD